MVEHVDEDDLALVALGETVPDAVRSHLDACPRCTQELASLSAVVAVGRSVTPADSLVAPAPAVWDRIRAELALPDGSAAPGAAHAAEPGPTTVAEPDAAPAVAPVVPLRRRSRVVPWIAAAAACGVVVGGAGAAWWADRADDGPPAEVLAEAALEPLPGWASSGDARVEVAADGERVLVVTLEGDGADEGYHEVWLIDRDVTRLVSLGVLTGTEGRFSVPTGLDLAEFPVVDVSDEPYDGDPAHSGDSIIRGVLDA